MFQERDSGRDTQEIVTIDPVSSSCIHPKAVRFRDLNRAGMNNKRQDPLMFLIGFESIPIIRDEMLPNEDELAPSL
jgi:hypothetical protein